MPRVLVVASTRCRELLLLAIPVVSESAESRWIEFAGSPASVLWGGEDGLGADLGPRFCDVNARGVELDVVPAQRNDSSSSHVREGREMPGGFEMVASDPGQESGELRFLPTGSAFVALGFFIMKLRNSRHNNLPDLTVMELNLSRANKIRSTGTLAYSLIAGFFFVGGLAATLRARGLSIGSRRLLRPYCLIAEWSWRTTLRTKRSG